MQERRVAVYVRSDVYAALNAKAACMQKSPYELAGMLLEAIAASDINDAVLDQ
jgi:hypothetical protein